LDALLGKSKRGRESLVEDADGLSIVKGKWKYIEPNNGEKYLKSVNIEMGNDPEPQLYDLSKDLGETDNVAKEHPDVVNELKTLLQKIQTDGRSR
jgi:arylsulfatase A